MHTNIIFSHYISIMNRSIMNGYKKDNRFNKKSYQLNKT